MNLFNLNFYCVNRKMGVSIGYCENCYLCNFHDGSSTWFGCVTQNLTCGEIPSSEKIVSELRMVGLGF